MIQVNLLPGAGGGAQSRTEFSLGGIVAGAASGVRDKYLLAACATVASVILGVGLTHMGQTSKERTLVERETLAVEDSTRYRVVLASLAKAEATRDSLYQHVAIIKSIDDSRYLWPHLLEEISNSLPQYTWLTTVKQTSAPPSSVVSDTARKSPAGVAPKQATAQEKKARADSVLAAASRATRFNIVGHTVDIQALTLFMKTLEASPFIQNVQLTRSDLVLVDNKEVTEFQLEAESQRPPPFLVRTVTMSVGDN